MPETLLRLLKSRHPKEKDDKIFKRLKSIYAIRDMWLKGENHEWLGVRDSPPEITDTTKQFLYYNNNDCKYYKSKNEEWVDYVFQSNK